jgi:hypothetical protein
MKNSLFQHSSFLLVLQTFLCQASAASHFGYSDSGANESIGPKLDPSYQQDILMSAKSCWYLQRSSIVERQKQDEREAKVDDSDNLNINCCRCCFYG